MKILTKLTPCSLTYKCQNTCCLSLVIDEGPAGWQLGAAEATLNGACLHGDLLDIIISSCQTISSLCSPAWSPWPPPWSPCPPHPRQWWGRQASCTPGHAPQLTGRLTNKVYYEKRF